MNKIENYQIKIENYQIKIQQKEEEIEEIEILVIEIEKLEKIKDELIMKVTVINEVETIDGINIFCKRSTNQIRTVF